MRTIKILQIIAQKPYSTGSGVYAKELVKSIANKGYEQAIVYGEDDNAQAWTDVKIEKYKVEFKSENLPFPLVGMSDIMPYESIIYSEMTKDQLSKFSKAFTDEVLKADSEFEPDIVICHHLYYLTALVTNLLPHRNVVAICHGTCLRQHMNHDLEKDFIFEGINKLNKIYALHKNQKLEIQTTFLIDEKKVEIIGCGYDKNIFYNQKINKKNKIVFAGKLSPSKGIEFLIDSLNYLEDAYEVEIVGSGSDLNFVDKIKAKAKKIEIESKGKHKISFCGRLDQIRLAEVFRNSEIFVLPSFYEGIPLTIIEAIACGMKIVFSNIDGPKEWLDDNMSSATIDYVNLPGRLDDNGEADFDIDSFGVNIACAIKNSNKREYNYVEDSLKKLGWDELCDKLVKNI